MRLTDPAQERRLAAFLETKLQPIGSRLIAPMRRQSAVIWWRVAQKELE
jgi:hypothetical protein